MAHELRKSSILMIFVLLLMFICYFEMFLMGQSRSYYSFFILVLPAFIIIALCDEMVYFNKKVVSTSLTIVLVLIWGLILYLPNYSVSIMEFYGIAGLSTIFVIIVVAFVFREWNKIVKAIKPYDKVLEINPNNITSLNNKGAELTNIKRFRWAMECFDKVLELEPEDSAALHNKGVVLTKLKKTREAARESTKYFDRALEADPGFENAKHSGKIILET